MVISICRSLHKVQRVDLTCDVTSIRLRWFDPWPISDEYSNFAGACAGHVTRFFIKLRLYYGTSSQIVFIRFSGELKTPKRHFKINWSLLRGWKTPKKDSNNAKNFTNANSFSANFHVNSEIWMYSRTKNRIIRGSGVLVKFLHVLQLIAGLIYNNFFLTPKATRFNFLHTQKSCFSCQAEMPKYVVSRRESTHSELRLPRRVLPNEILIGIRKYYSFDVHITALNLF